MSEFTLKAGTSGVEASAKQQEVKIAAEASAALGAASASKSDDATKENQPLDDEKVREIANIVSQAVKPQFARQFAEASVLWVDDNPSTSRNERIALEALGIHVITSTSTDDALEKTRLNKYDVIVSTMKRLPDKQAGYTLLEELQKHQTTLYFIIYGQSDFPIAKDEVSEKGAFGCTNNPQELFQLVTSAIEKKQRILQYSIRATGSNRAAQAELAILKMLEKTTLPGEGEIEVNKGDYSPDFFIVEPDGTRTGVAVKYRSNPHISSMDITKLYSSIFDNAKTRIDKLRMYFVFPDENTTKVASERLFMPTSVSILPDTTISTGYLYGDIFVTTYSVFSIKASVPPPFGLAKFDN